MRAFFVLVRASRLKSLQHYCIQKEFINSDTQLLLLVKMSLPERSRRLRNSIKDTTLLSELQNIWDSAEKELHPFQKGRTAQGFQHCIRVEGNIWSLIQKDIAKFRDQDLFLLSATAALHDVGKINQKVDSNSDEKIDHGTLGKELLLKGDNWKKYFREKTEASAVAHIIGVHCNGKINTIPAEFAWGNPPGILLRSLAAIFRLADMLDSDYRRCPYLAYSFKKLEFPEVLLWSARRSITGWRTSHDGQSIVMIASPETEEDKIRTLAYVDSLNNMLTASHKKYLENCRVRYWVAEPHSKIEEHTIYLPTKFCYGQYEKGAIKEIGGLVDLYTDFANNYMSRMSTIFSDVDLRGIGDFGEKRITKLSKVFIDVNVTLESSWASESYEDLEEKAGKWLTKLLLAKSVPFTELVAVENLKSVVILGDPGSGKTTISHYLCSKYQLVPGSTDETPRIPFLVTIRDFATKRGKNPDLTLLEYISTQVAKIVESSVPLGFVEYWLSKSGTLIIFDGLDEVIRPDEREQVRDLVTNFRESFPESRIIVNSRIVGYDEAPLDRNKFIHLRLCELEKAQVKSFVENWYNEREPNPLDREAAIKGLLEALKDEHVSELAKNPLLLTIMALVHRGEADLPKQRALLYNKCVEAFMVSRNRAKDLLSYDEHEIRACHEFLGYWIQKRAEKVSGGSSEVPIRDLRENLLKDMAERHSEMSSGDCKKKVEEFIDAAKKRVGLLVERGEGIWAFGHRSFQEYFAARYISQNTFGIESLWAEIQNKIESSHWVEPLKLLAGIYGESNRHALDEFTARILDEHLKVEDPLAKRLILLGEIAGEIHLKYPFLKKMAAEITKKLFDTKDYTVMSNCKRILNHFYNTALWTDIIDQITKIAKTYKEHRQLYTGTAFLAFINARKFDDSRIDRVLSCL